MISRKLALGLAAVSLALVGCDNGTVDPPIEGTTFPERDFVCADGASAPCDTTEPARTDAERTAEEPGDLDNQSFVYVVNWISIPEPSSGRAPGFNLDGINSGETGDPAGDCEHFTPDFRAVNDDHVGVDNALATLVPTIESLALDGEDLDDVLLEQINEGSVLLGVRVTGVDSFDYDANIQMQLVLLQIPGGGTPTLGGDGRLAPGQTYEVAMELGIAVNGDIFDGRVRAQTASLLLQINTGDFNLPLEISQPEVRFNISAEGLTAGTIGGFITIDAIVEAAAAAGGIDEATVRPVVEGYADIDPSAADPMVCEALSVGLSFEATTTAGL